MTAIVRYQILNGVSRRLSAQCEPRGPATPGITDADVRAEVVKLVPAAAIGSAPPAAGALVNLESLFWVQTPAVRDLGTVALLGHQVHITISAKSTKWDFGDDATDTSDGPGRPYTKDDHCREKQCPDWFGHTYTETGVVTVHATVNWTADYTVDGGTTQRIQGTIAGPTAALQITVKQARAVLVAPTN